MGKEKYDKFDFEEVSRISPEYFNEIAGVLEAFLQFSKKFVIYKKLSEEQYRHAIKTVKRTIKQLKKGDPSPMDIERLSDAVIRGEIPDEYLQY